MKKLLLLPLVWCFSTSIIAQKNNTGKTAPQPTNLTLNEIPLPAPEAPVETKFKPPGIVNDKGYNL